MNSTKQKYFLHSIVLLLLITCSFSTNSFAQWTVNTTLPSSYHAAFDIHFIDNNIGFIGGTTSLVGGNGKISKTTNGGVTWNDVFSMPNKIIKDFYFVNTTLGFAVGSGGLIAKTIDGGNTWTSQIYTNPNTLTPEAFESVYFVDQNTGFIAGGYYEMWVLKTTDGGANWTPLTMPSYFQRLKTVHFTDANTGYVAGGDGTGGGIGRVYKTINGGTTWDTLSTGIYNNYFNDIVFTDANNGVIGCDVDGILLKTSDAGQNWIQVTNPAGTSQIEEFSFVNSNIGYACNIGGKIIKTIDGGNTWSIDAGVRPTMSTLYSISVPTLTYGASVGLFGEYTEMSPICGNPISTDTQIACDSLVWIDGNTYTTSNNYASFNIPGGSSNGCDSLIVLDLTIPIIDSTINLNGVTISSNQTGASYQWLNCSGYSLITGEISQTYTPNIAGSYAVEITLNGCVDTSACITLDTCNISSSFTYINNGNGNYTFNNTSTGGNPSYFWDFGDGNVSSQTNPIHNYSANGTYIVSLTISDSNTILGNSCIDSFSDTITVTGIIIGFGSQNDISKSTFGADDIKAFDLDNDGKNDMLMASFNDSKIAWHKNLGSGGFGTQQIISLDVMGATSVYAADLDNDGDLDVLSSSYEDHKIAWYENLGSGLFGTQQIITANVFGARSVHAVDMDNDGDMDVLSASQLDDKIAWYENLGGGIFGSQNVIFIVDAPWSVYATDIDGDGDKDVLSVSANLNRVYWHENLGGGAFSTFIISGATNTAQQVYAADLDGDGDMDVLSASEGDDKIAWYENLGSGSFGTQNILSTFTNGPHSVYASDLDSDGDLDVLSASIYDNKIAIFENMGSGSFGTQQNISTNINFANSVYTSDLDGDGDMDILAGAPHKNEVTWFENQGNFTFNIHQFNMSVKEPFSSHATDLDGDGIIDVLSASQNDNKVSWYKNLGCGIFDAQQIIDSNLSYAYSVYSADIDGDGDQDVISGGTHDIRWYENLGGTFGTPQIINTSFAQSVSSVYAADLDGDGDMDVLSSSHAAKKIAWYENLGGGTFSGQRIIIVNGAFARSVYAADIDNDGDMDVLSASQNDNKIAWYENLGNGLFGNQQTISTSAYSAQSVYAADIDNDGDIDVLSASRDDDKIAWYENLGSGTFGPQQIISNTADAAWHVYATDIDNDGNIDVFSASTFDNKIAWYRNLGGGSFSSEQIISTKARDPSSIFAADIDNDGDLDVLSSSKTDDRIAWYENYLHFPNINGEIFYFTNQNICSGDSILLSGSYQYNSGIYVDSVQSICGYMAITSTTLTVNPIFTSNQNATICQGDSILLYGVYQNTTGIYYDSLQAINGCDSILSTTLTVNPTFTSNQNVAICQGDSILLYGVYQNTTGIYYDSLQAINGCDSILSTTLTVNPTFTSNQNVAICQGDSILLYGVYQNTTGIYYDSLQAINGCDSILSTTLAINPLPSVSIAAFNPDTLCNNGSVVVLPAGSPMGGSYSGSGVVGGIFDPVTAGVGIHDIIYTYIDGNSCINSDTTVITIQLCTGIDDISNDFGILIYPNPNTGKFTIEKPSGLNKEVKVKLLDAASKLIMDKVMPIGKQKVEMDITSYSKGIYYLQLIVDDEVFVKQILKN